MDSKKMCEAINEALDDKKGVNIHTLDVAGSTVGADFFVIVTGTSVTHAKALSDAVDEKMKKGFNILPFHVEGYPSAKWILLDYKDVVVHIFLGDERDHYAFDDLWSATAIKRRIKEGEEE